MSDMVWIVACSRSPRQGDTAQDCLSPGDQDNNNKEVLVLSLI